MLIFWTKIVKINAQKFESAFYSNPDLRKSGPPQEEKTEVTLDINALIEQLKQSPELATTLAAIISGQQQLANSN